MERPGRRFAAWASACLGAALIGSAVAAEMDRASNPACSDPSTADQTACDLPHRAGAALKTITGRLSILRWTPPPRSNVFYAGYNCTVDAMHPWSVRSSNGNEVSFEVRPGDRLFSPVTGYQDPTSAERAELAFPSSRWRNGSSVRISYEFLVPRGFHFDAPWTVVGQMHADLNVSPPVEFAFRSG